MDADRTNQLCHLATQWVLEHDDLRGLLLVGSWARHEARPDSDLDLVIICTQPEQYRDLRASPIPFEFVQQKLVEYGAVFSHHVTLADGAEVELAFAALSWAATDPMDDGTREVISRGMKSLVDKDGLLKELAHKKEKSASADS